MPAINRYPRVYVDPEEMNLPLAFNGVPDKEIVKFRFAFSDIIRKDSGQKSFGFSADFLNMTCTDIDRAVIFIGGDNDRSMDCSVSIANYDAVHQEFSNRRWLLVELKLNSTVAKNDKDTLAKKVSDTEAFISCDVVDCDRVFIYPEEVQGSKKSLFDEWKNGSNGRIYKNWRCLSPKMFEEYLLLRQNISYKCVFAPEHIAASFKDITEADPFSNKLTYWRGQAEDFKNQGNTCEYENILSSIAVIYSKFLDSVDDDTDKLILKMDWDFLNDFL